MSLYMGVCLLQKLVDAEKKLLVFCLIIEKECI